MSDLLHFFDDKYTIKYKEYLNNNVLSIVDSNARSNNARYINLVTNIKVAEKHIIFGVGEGLKRCIYSKLFELRRFK